MKEQKYIGHWLLAGAGLVIGFVGMVLVISDSYQHEKYPNLFPSLSEYAWLGVAAVVVGLLLIGVAALLERRK